MSEGAKRPDEFSGKINHPQPLLSKEGSLGKNISNILKI
jgi:hypothetical protein